MSSETIVSFTADQIAVRNHRIGGSESEAHRDAGGPELAADSRSFPVFIYDPRKGARFRERLSLVGNPNVKEDWYVNPKTGGADRLRLLRPH